MTLIDEIKRDREFGSPGDWTLEILTSSDPNGDEWETDVEVLSASGTHIHSHDLGYSDETDARIKADTRRIARVPDMEAALMAADELAGAARHYRDFVLEHNGTGEIVPIITEPAHRLQKALKKFTNAIGAT